MPSATLLPDGLARALADKPTVVIGSEDDAGGARVGTAPWKLPDAIPADWLDGARAYVRDLQAKDVPACEFPGGLEIVKQWILQLLAGVSHSLSSDGVIARGMALRDVVEHHPLWCFTRANRIRAARRFQFVPTAKELADFVAEIDAEVRQPARRVMQVLDAGARAPRSRDDGEPWHQRSDFKWSKAEAEAHGERLRERKRRENAELAAKIAADRGEPPVPQRGPGESDELFMQRLRHHRHTVLDAATAEFKRGKFAGLRPLGEFAGARRSDDPALQARAEAMTARGRAEADELAARIEGAAE